METSFSPLSLGEGPGVRLQQSFEAYKNCRTEAEKQAFLSEQQKRIEYLSPEASKEELKAIAEELKDMLQTLKTNNQKKAA